MSLQANEGKQNHKLGWVNRGGRLNGNFWVWKEGRLASLKKHILSELESTYSQKRRGKFLRVKMKA